MRQPQSFAEEVTQNSAKQAPKEREKFEMISLNVFPVLALDKEY